MQEHLIRAIDIALSFLGIIISLPIMVLIFFAGIFETGSPLFFQLRVGKHQKIFKLVKFRTMTTNTKSVGSHLIDGSSITKFGRFLRKNKLDELPQLFNVFLGQMSLVGPRPCLPNQTELINEREQRGGFSIRTGITGLAQIKGIDMSTPKKLSKYDQLMISKMNITFLGWIIASTIIGGGRGDQIRKSK